MSKTSYVAGIVVLVWAAVVWRWSNNIMADAGLLMVGLIATGFAAWFIRGTQKFAERNPAQALLEGAELLEWRKMEVAAQGIPAPAQPILVEDMGGLSAPEDK